MTGKTPRRKANCLFESMTEPVRSRIDRIGSHHEGTCRVLDYCGIPGSCRALGYCRALDCCRALNCAGDIPVAAENSL